MKQAKHKLDLKSMDCWRIQVYIETAIVLILFFVIHIIVSRTDASNIVFPIWLMLVISYIVLSVLRATVLMRKKYEGWSYEVSPHEVFIAEGVFFRQMTQIPMNRIQHITVKQGPVARKYQLSVIEIVTAASTIEIEYLSSDHAEKVCEEIKRHALLSDEYE
ncbi:PH domain-containing protein [Paenibacillus sp. FSL R7-0331]|uniref:PH domain-containing protein n=1 Tax=Paenibacillus sp. FSL R7-0331 TaxID=1536773 RepID=UPI0006947052|nr:PH domain-containing protein [Paenibacillus sp. FSL R7-0331]